MSNLQHYIETGTIPDSNPELLEQLLREAEGNTEALKVEDVKEEGEPSTAEASPETKEPDKEPEGILSKNGKHIISYDKLLEERQARQQYQRETEELKRQIEALKSGQADFPPLSELTGLSEEKLAELKEVFPEEYEALVKQNQHLLSATQKIKEFELREQQRALDERQKASLVIQEEIDNNPVLSYWQTNDPEIWDKCIKLDAELMQSPATAKLTMAERFDKVAKAIAQIYGSPIKEPVKEDVPAKEEAKPVEKPKPKVPPINSLSDIKGGEAPEASEKNRVQDMSAVELGNILMKMTPKEQDAYLSRL